MTNEELLAQMYGGTTEQESSGIAGFDIPSEMTFTGEASAADRMKYAAQGISQIYPVHEPAYYEKAAGKMYPETNYQKEKFWNDIMLGLNLLTGRSEEGQFFPVLEEGLEKWLGRGQPIREAETARGAQVAASAAEMREDDVENFQNLMGQAFISDMNAQLKHLAQFEILSDAEATLAGLPVDEGQVWRRNKINQEISAVQARIPAKDSFSILSTKEAAAQGLDTTKGQVWQRNEGTNQVTKLVGMDLSPNWEVLSPEEAAKIGLPVENGQVWSQNKTDKETKQIFGVNELPQTWTTLSREQASTFVGEKNVANGEVYQRNNITGKVEELIGFKTPSPNWNVLSDDEAAKQNLPVNNGEVWMQEKVSGKVQQLHSGPVKTARDHKIADMIEILRANNWGETETQDGKKELPTEAELKNHAVKLVDGEIQLIPQPDGRIFSLDTTTKELTLLTSDHKGEFPYIAEVKPVETITEIIDGEEVTRDVINPYAIKMDPPQQVLMELPPKVVEDINTRIQHLSWAHIVAEDIITRLQEVVGPQGWFKSLITGTFAILPAGMDQWALFLETERGKQQMELFTRAMIQALALNPRFPVAEQEMIKQIVPEGTKFWRDPKVAFVRFNEMMRYIQNALAYERASLQIERTPWYTMGAIPTGTSHDPIKLWDAADEEYFNQLTLPQQKGLMLQWEPGGDVEPAKGIE